ncbi:Csu type fimbrial protein [Rhodanobacter sp. Col0626]|uniref:Csu type fimbrial protein n=1 Tax=Rhodanobacter sp. Col0626 TaxID=3415679 RepID=UPI003CF7D027
MHTNSTWYSSKSALSIAMILAIGTMTGTAQAASPQSSSLAVSATVTANCTIDASAGLSFGEYDTIGANLADALSGEGSISTTCTNGFTAKVTLGEGLNADTASTGEIPLRRMLSGTDDYLSYQLCSDSNCGTVWGNTSDTGVDVVGTGAPVSTPVYGSIAGGQNVKVGNYSDTVLATVTF